MTKLGEQNSLANVIHSPPILSAHRDPLSLDAGTDVSDDIKSYLNILYEGRWLIFLMTVLVTSIAILYALLAPPVYEASLTIHVEDESANTSSNIVRDASSAFGPKKGAIAEIALLRSRMVVAQAVDNLQLFIEVRPKYFPVATFWFANRHGRTLSTPGFFGYGGYAWGGEQADVSIFNVPEPWLDREFALTVQGPQRYRFSGAGQQIVFDGLVGDHYSIQTQEGPLDIRVDNLDAKPGAVFLIKRRSRLGTIEAVQNAMVISEQGTQSGYIAVKLQGDNALSINKVLTEVAREYLRQNFVRTTEQTEKSLAFVNKQLPVLKHQLEESEDRYNQFRHSHGTVDLREEASMSMQQHATARDRRSDLLQKKTEMMARFTEDHPLVVALNRQRKEVEAEIDEIAARMKKLPALELDEERLTRDIKVNTDLYTAMSNTAQQLRLVSAGSMSNVRMIDAPIVPEVPLKPNRVLIMMMGLATGLCLGVLTAFGRRVVEGGIDHPLKIERLLHARAVYATIPYSVVQDKLARKSLAKGISKPLLAKMAPEDPAVESLRGFRVALQFAMPHFKNNIVVLTGPTRDLGKSFIAANFSVLIAASGKRVLLIDADLRAGHLHRYFGVERGPGLSAVISGSLRVEETIHHDVIDHLDFISNGVLPPSRSELLLHLNFLNLLETVSPAYDLVLIDTPPVLAVADTLIIGAHAGAVFMVARSGITTENQIQESIKRMNQAGISPQGVLFNGMSPRLSLATTYSVYGQNARLILPD